MIFHIGHTVGGGEGEEQCVGAERVAPLAPDVEWYVRNVSIYVSCGEIRLLRCRRSAVDGCVYAPEGGVCVQAFPAHEILVLSPVSAVGQPQPAVDGMQYGVCLGAVG